MLKRRRFLKQSALVSGGLALSSLSGFALHRKRAERRGAPKRVIILGAGLAGMSAGYELAEAGHDVLLLEARSRPGGRVYTLRKPFADGLYAEAGATRIPENHHWTMKYVDEFGLELDEFRPTDLQDVHYVHGSRIVAGHGDAISWPVELTPEERTLGLTGMRRKYVTPVLKEMGNVGVFDWSPPESVREFDEMTWTEFLAARGASPGAVELLTMGHSSGLYGEMSALQMLRVSVEGRTRRQMFKIRGGNDLLPQAFASRLKEKIRFNSQAVRIEHDDQGVRVAFLESGKQQSVSGDLIICAIPFSLLKNIDVRPGFSAEKRRAIEQLWYTSIARVSLQTRARFWQGEGLSGFAQTDLPIMESWNLTHNAQGTRGILAAYCSGPSARAITAMNEADRVAYTVKQMELLFPGIREHFEFGVSVCWDEEQWSRGAWSWLKPGQAKTILPYISRSEGRIHFAGDHTSAWSSWMQGALESGNRVAQRVIEQP